MYTFCYCILVHINQRYDCDVITYIYLITILCMFGRLYILFETEVFKRVFQSNNMGLFTHRIIYVS